MKKYLWIISTCVYSYAILFIVILATNARAISINNFILAGQSNIAGQSVGTISINSKVWRLQHNGVATSPAPDPLDSFFVYANFHTFALDFANKFVDTFNTDIGLIPMAVGATGLIGSGANYWGYRSASIDTSTLYWRTVYWGRYWDSVSQSHCKALIWYQGENEAYYKIASSLYASAFRTMITNFRQDFGYKIPVIIIPLSKVKHTGYDQDSVQAVRLAQQTLENLDSAYYVVPWLNNAGLEADNIHINLADCDTLGKRVLDVYKRILRGNYGSQASPLPGNKVSCKITINHNKIVESQNHIPFPIDLGRMVTSWWTNVNSASDIVVYDSVNNRIVPRVVSANFNISNKIGSMHIDAHVSNVTDVVYKIYSLPAFQSKNDAAVFANSNAFQAYGFDEASGTTYNDDCQNFSGTGSVGWIHNKYAPGACGAAISDTNLTNNYIDFGTGSPLNGARKASIVFIMKPNVLTTLSYFYIKILNDAATLYQYQNQLHFSPSLLTGHVDDANYLTDVVPGNWYSIAGVFDSSLAESSIAKIMINGVDKTTGMTNDILSHFPAENGSNMLGYTSTASIGSIAIMQVYSDAKTSGYLQTQTNAYLDTGTVSIVSTAASTIRSKLRYYWNVFRMGLGVK